MWLAYNTLVVLLGVSLLGAAAGTVGAFAVLRRKALTGDALAHAALPGLCLAFLTLELLLQYPLGQRLLGSLGIDSPRSLPAMMVGALLTGLLGIGVIAALRRWTRIKEDAALGIVLSVPVVHLPRWIARVAARLTTEGEDFSDRWSARAPAGPEPLSAPTVDAPAAVSLAAPTPAEWRYSYRRRAGTPLVRQ